MDYVFLDTNVLHDLYRLPAADHKELEKLVKLVEESKIHILTTSQVRDEYARNREKVIADALEELRRHKISGGYSVMIRDTPLGVALPKMTKEFNVYLDEVHEAIEEAAIDAELSADKLIERLFEVAVELSVDHEVTQAAHLRVLKGNPPGKKGAEFGDAINWEAALASAKHGLLVWVSNDGDYFSQLSNDRFNRLLHAEALAAGWADATIFRGIRELLQAKYPSIHLTENDEAELAVADLESSNTYSFTHDVVERLERHHHDLNTAQALRVFVAVTENDQVADVARDVDVQRYLNRVLRDFGALLDESIVEQVRNRAGL